MNRILVHRIARKDNLPLRLSKFANSLGTATRMNDATIPFLLGLALMTMHEMDAIRCREWRIFPGLSLLPDRLGFLLFMLAHIPLFYLIFDQLTLLTPSFRVGFDAFMMAHVGAHGLLYRHPRNTFTDWVSWTLIGGAGLCGGVDLLLL